MNKSSRLKQLDRALMVPRQPEHAFTLIELLVVLAMVALLAMTLLPALAKTKYPSLVSSCAANYRQWVDMASVYASDDPQGCMPSFNCPGAGGNPTDVATNFVVLLTPYGMTIPMYFCPARPLDVDVANQQFNRGINNLPAQHRYIQSINDLNLWVWKGRSVNMGYAKLIHLWWVPRETGLPNRGPQQPDGGYLFPWPNWGSIPTAPVGAVPWPRKISDATVSQQPIISDYTELVGSTDINDFAKLVPQAGQIGFAHFYNGSLQSVNVGFADGHVDNHPRKDMAWQFTGDNNTFSYFY
ncbi:MAG: type II secretion system protein [Verrucomicrobiota bacterium]|jgi:prepilin-type N-terminal cleavage/methylation domain-containing protein/prepilin-type processing-associated H-X9-DG protein